MLRHDARRTSNSELGRLKKDKKSNRKIGWSGELLEMMVQKADRSVYIFKVMAQPYLSCIGSSPARRMHKAEEGLQ